MLFSHHVGRAGTLAALLALAVAQDSSSDTTATATATTTSETSTSTTSATASASTVTQALSQLTLSSDFVITTEASTRTYDWEISTMTGAPDGFYKPMLVVNGQYPGPTIEANDGDTIVVNVQNSMDVGTTIHWHGLLQNGTPWMDGPVGVAQCPIPAGGSFTYNFTISGQYGTYWWHAHAAAQLADGINGAFIVHSPDDPLVRGVDFDEDQVLIIGDWYHDTAANIAEGLESAEGYQGTFAAPSPNSAMINGQGTWDCATYGSDDTCFTQTPLEIQVVPDKKYRFRLINAAAHAMFYFSVDSHTLNVTEADDTPVFSESTASIHRVPFHDGERYSVIVDTSVGSVGDAYWIRSAMNTDCWGAELPEDISNTTYAIMRYVDSVGSADATTDDPTTSDWTDVLGGDDCTDLDSNWLVPIVVEAAPTEVVSRGIFDTSFTMASTDSGDTVGRFAVNSTVLRELVYQPILFSIAEGNSVNSTNVASITLDTVGAADIIINNMDASLEHPYHLHGFKFYIVAQGSGVLTYEDALTLSYNTTNPMRRDTMVIPRNSYAVLRIQVDNPGVWFLHCHIDWHLAVGFAAVVVSQPSEIQAMSIPSAATDLCASSNIPDGLDIWSTSLGKRTTHKSDGSLSRRDSGYHARRLAGSLGRRSYDSL